MPALLTTGTDLFCSLRDVSTFDTFSKIQARDPRFRFIVLLDTIVAGDNYGAQCLNMKDREKRAERIFDTINVLTN